MAAVQLLAMPLAPQYEAQRARGLALLEAALRGDIWTGRTALTAARPHLTALEQACSSAAPESLQPNRVMLQDCMAFCTAP